MTADTCLIYGLRDPRTSEIRYVGKTKIGLRRAMQHLDARLLETRTRKTSWIKSLLAAGLTYEPVVLEYAASLEDLDAAERRWIAIGRAALGDRLTNMTDGGDGLMNPSTEVRKKLARAQVRRTGEKRSPETRARLSAAAKRCYESPEFRERQRQGVLKKHEDAEYRARRRAGLLKEIAERKGRGA